jgi:hypothetical protein
MKSAPLLVLIVAVYNVLAFSSGELLDSLVWKIKLPSGDEWHFAMNGLLVCLSIVFLYVEIVKAARRPNASALDHVLSTALLVLCLLEFTLISGFGNTTFLVITLAAFLNVVGGFTVSTKAARRDFVLGR